MDNIELKCVVDWLNFQIAKEYFALCMDCICMSLWVMGDHELMDMTHNTKHTQAAILPGGKKTAYKHYKHL